MPLNEGRVGRSALGCTYVLDRAFVDYSSRLLYSDVHKSVGNLQRTWVVVVTKDGVSSLPVTGQNYSSIEAITDSSIDEKGIMGTQWWRHRASWIREE
jgi:hypothetical protein